MGSEISNVNNLANLMDMGEKFYEQVKESEDASGLERNHKSTEEFDMENPFYLRLMAFKAQEFAEKAREWADRLDKNQNSNNSQNQSINQVEDEKAIEEVFGTKNVQVLPREFLEEVLELYKAANGQANGFRAVADALDEKSDEWNLKADEKINQYQSTNESANENLNMKDAQRAFYEHLVRKKHDKELFEILQVIEDGGDPEKAIVS